MAEVTNIETYKRGEVRHHGFSPEQLSLIKRTVAADCNNQEFDLFAEVSRRIGLDPFRKQIHAVIYNKDRPEKRKMAIITGIDGFRAVAQRCGDYRPDDDEPHIEYDENIKSETNPLGIVKAVVAAYKFGNEGQWHRVTGAAYWDEFVPLREKWAYDEAAGKKQPTGEFWPLDRTSNWFRMPRVMISKCAEAQALRKGWPETLAGVYAQEEMEQAKSAAMASDLADQYEQEKRQELLGGPSILAAMKLGGALENIPVGQFADRMMGRLGEFGPDDYDDFVGWRETNREAFRQFWAVSKADAIELSRKIETKSEEYK